MYRVYFNPINNKVSSYEDELTAPKKTNSFLIDEIPQGEGIPYVNLDTQTVYFIIPAPTPTPEPTPEERLTSLEAENKLLKVQSQALSAQLDFQEEVITELILTVVP